MDFMIRMVFWMWYMHALKDKSQLLEGGWMGKGRRKKKNAIMVIYG